MQNASVTMQNASVAKQNASVTMQNASVTMQKSGKKNVCYEGHTTMRASILLVLVLSAVLVGETDAKGWWRKAVNTVKKVVKSVADVKRKVFVAEHAFQWIPGGTSSASV
nr:hypothetical protein BaRGS_023632 [Batillaria attramentaria]